METITKEELIKKIKEYESTNRQNRMGCSENWYSYVYAIKQTFTIEEIIQMSEEEIQHLIKLAQNIQDGLW